MVAPAKDAASDPNSLTPTERRDKHMRVDQSQCEAGAKHANVVRGLKDTDPKGIHLLSGCLKWGNVAWYACITAATTPDAVQRCNERLLQPPDE